MAYPLTIRVGSRARATHAANNQRELAVKRTTFSIALTLISAALQSAPAQATIFRTFVSAHGSDANPCTLAAPCRTFAAAIASSPAGGRLLWRPLCYAAQVGLSVIRYHLPRIAPRYFWQAN